MGVLNVPKAVYKAQQAKKKMSKIQAAGKDEAVSILMNGLSEVAEVEIDSDDLMSYFDGMDIDPKLVEKISKRLSKNFLKAYADAKKQIEKQLMSSASLDDLKEMLGGA
jgi:DNA-binding protein YbaB